MSDVVVITPLMMLRVVELFPIHPQAIFRSAGSLGADIYEELVVRRKVSQYVEDIRLGERYVHTPNNSDDYDPYSLASVVMDVESMFDHSVAGDDNMLTLLYEVHDQLKWCGKEVSTRFTEWKKEKRDSQVASVKSFQDHLTRTGKGVYGRMRDVAEYPLLRGIEDVGSMDSYYVGGGSRNSSSSAAPSNATTPTNRMHHAIASVCSKWASQYYAALTYAHPPTPAAAPLACLDHEESTSPSSAASSSASPLNAELQKGDDNLFPVGEVVRAVGEAITSIPVTQTIQKVSSIPQRIVAGPMPTQVKEDAPSHKAGLGVVFGRRLSSLYKW